MKKIIQKGFTLIELMVAIALGMLIVAAGLFIFLNSLKNARLQEGISQIQDSGIFGLDYLARDIRLANYGNAENRSLNDETARGGVILTTGLPTQSNINLAVGNGNATTAFPNLILTQSGNNTSNTGSASNVDIRSDQLTIQFTAPNNMKNCEGQIVFKGDLVVQRYFLRKEANKNNYDQNVQSLGLACAANAPATAANVNATPKFITSFQATNMGEIIIPNADYFGFLLGARVGQNYRYFTVDQYLAEAEAARAATPARVVPSIEMIKIAVLIRSENEMKSTPIMRNQFEILGRTINLKAPTNNKTNQFVRNVYVTTIALRNALGDK